TGAIFHTEGFIAGMGKQWQRVQVRDGETKISGETERAQLVVNESSIIEIAIQLGDIESGRVGHCGMAHRTFAAAGIMPALGAEIAAIIDRKRLIRSFRWDQ